MIDNFFEKKKKKDIFYFDDMKFVTHRKQKSKNKYFETGYTDLLQKQSERIRSILFFFTRVFTIKDLTMAYPSIQTESVSMS